MISYETCMQHMSMSASGWERACERDMVCLCGQLTRCMIQHMHANMYMPVMPRDECDENMRAEDV